MRQTSGCSRMGDGPLSAITDTFGHFITPNHLGLQGNVVTIFLGSIPINSTHFQWRSTNCQMAAPPPKKHRAQCEHIQAYSQNDKTQIQGLSRHAVAHHVSQYHSGFTSRDKWSNCNIPGDLYHQLSVVLRGTSAHSRHILCM